MLKVFLVDDCDVVQRRTSNSFIRNEIEASVAGR
jgi:hypothetical protein